ncbi:MAG TPA: Ig-like domain repeat protein [Bryobacteraceae bacterium]|nr:Ig-like domain repeat protein [Bryobacteraceae bacterium]
MSQAKVFELPEAPDFLVVGNFIGEGHLDVAVGARGSHTLYILANDGKGGLLAPLSIALSGPLSALSTAHLDAGTAYSQIVAGTGAPTGGQLTVFEGTAIGLNVIATSALRAPPTSLAFGSLTGDSLQDVALISAGQLAIVHGRDVHAARVGQGPAILQPESVSLPFAAASVAVGAFIQDRASRLQMAVLGTDGSVHIVTRAGLDTRPWSLAEVQARHRAIRAGQPDPLAIPADPAEGWQVAESFPAVVSAANANLPPVFFRTRISSRGADDVMVLDSTLAQVHVLSHESMSSAGTAPSSLPSSFHSTLAMSPSQATVAGIPMRVNIDGRPGVVVLKQGQMAPQVMMPLPDPTFFPNRFDDITPRATAVTCLNTAAVDGSGDCTLREAILKANATAGTDTIMVAAGTYTLTLPKVANDFSGQHGALYVNDSVNIIGAGQNTTIIQAGTLGDSSGTPNGVDMVMAVNEDINPPTDATASISNLTLQNGHNRGTLGNDGDGGCMEFDTGTSGTANLTLTNVTLNNCDTLQGDGAGIAIFNFTKPLTGFATVNNSIFQNNSAVTTGAAGSGGGIWVTSGAQMVMTNSQVINNKATQINGSSVGVGGGIFIIGPSSAGGRTAIHSSTISGNHSSGDGGGVWTTQGALFDQSTVISNNVSAGQGGGIWANIAPATLNLTKVTITGNSATGNGGGVHIDDAGGAVNIQFSRLTGNTTGGLGSNLHNRHDVNPDPGTAVTAQNNWWGTNSPSATIDSGTSTCPAGPHQVCFDPFIVLAHTASPNKIQINQSTTLTADMSKDNHGSAVALAGNLDVFNGLAINFHNAILGTIPQAQPETLNASAQATATYNAGGVSGNGSADATVDQQTITATITISQPPSIAKSFSPKTIQTTAGTGVTVSTITFAINNPNSVPINASFTDNLPTNIGVGPGNLVVATTPSVVNTCGGSVTATAGSSSITFSNATLPAGACNVQVNVQSSVDNAYTNSVTIDSTDAGNGNTSSDTLTVVNPPHIVKAFGQPSIPFFSTTSLTFTISNPNQNVTLNGTAFTDTLPPASPGRVIVATPNSLTNTCGGSPTAASGSSSIALSGASLAPGASCAVSVSVQGVTIGAVSNSVLVLDTVAGTGNTSTALVTVVAANTTTAVVSSVNPSVFGQSVTFTATVSPVPPAAGTATGTVTFLDGGSPIGTGTLSAGVASFTTSALALGNHTITTSYGGDGNFNGSTGSLTGNPQVVNKANTTTAVTSSQNPSVFGQAVTFTATVAPVAPGAGTATGTVTFLDGGSPIGTGTLSGAVATFSTSALAAGSHTITTSYGGDGNFNGSTGSLTGNPQIVNKADTTTAVNSSQNPSSVGQSVTFTATVSPVAPGSGIPTGTVTFLDGGSPIGTGTLSGGVATFSTSALAAGSHTITTSYGGDGSFNGSTGSLTGNPQVVNKANTTTAVNSSQNPSVFGQSVTFTATVSPVSPAVGTPTGTVTFLDGGSPIGTGTLSAGVATFTTSALAAGLHTITTSYGGDPSFNGSTGSLTGNPQAVNKAITATTVASSQNPSDFGQSVTFTATISPVAPGAGTPTGAVTFLDGGSPIGSGTLSGGLASFTTSALAVGNHTITTTYGGDGNFNASTGSLTGNPQVVTKTGTATTIVSSQNPSVFGQSVSFTATVSPVAPGAGTPTGTVTFLDGGSPIGTVTLSGGLATFTTSALAIGNHTITTTYSGDGNFNASTGSLTGNPQVVTKANTATALTSSQNPSALAQSVTFTATVSALAPAIGTPTGTLTFLDGGSSIGTATLSAGVATFTTSALTAGSHTITSSYAGDANFNGDTGSLTGNPQVVLTAPTATKVFAPASIAPNGVSAMTITITNPAANPLALAGLAFTDSFPANLVVATPNGLTNTCGGTATAVAGSGTVSLTGGTVASNRSCTVTVNVTSSVSGSYLNTTGPISSTNGGTGTSASGTLSVAVAPIISKLFGATTMPLNGTTSLTFSITNPNSVVALTGVAFTDSLPSGLVVSTPNALTGTCGGGTITATAGSSAVSLAGATLTTSGSCTFSVNVTAVAGGVKINTVQVTSTNGGTGNTSSATVTATIPPVLSKVFGAANIPLNGSTSLSFTVQNNNATQSLSGVAFTDTLPAGLLVSTPNGLTGTCGGGAITAAAGSGTVSLTAATLAGTASCTFSVNVTGVAAGSQNNTTGNVTSVEGGAGAPASATLVVIAPPSIVKAFNPAAISPNGTSTLTFTITNPAANSVALTGVAFTDVLPTGILSALPAGLTNTCGGTLNVQTAAGVSTVNHAGGTIAAASSCTISLNVTSSTPGVYTNTTGAVSSTNGGTGNTATASLAVAMPPSITKSFGAASIGLAGSTSLSFTVTNPNASIAFAGVAFTDALPAGLVVSTPNGLTGTCGSGNVTAVAGSSTVTLAGGTIPTSATCSFAVNVTAVTPGNQVNTTGTVSATNGGTGNTATASINVLAPDVTIVKSHTGNFFQGQTGAAYSITVNNIGPGPTAGTVTVTDTLPAGLTATAMAGTGWNCTVATLSCTRTDALASGASYPAIVVTVNVAASAPASVSNLATVAGGGELNTANDTATDLTTITVPPDFSLAITTPVITIRAGQTANYAFTVNPLNNNFSNPITFSLTGLPDRSSFAFAPASVTPGSTPAPVTLNILTTAGDPFLAQNAQRTRMPLYAMFLPFTGLILSGIGFRKGKLVKKWVLAIALFACAGFTLYGCASAQNFKKLGTPPGTYALTITASSGPTQHSSPVTLIVTP